MNFQRGSALAEDNAHGAVSRYIRLKPVRICTTPSEETLYCSEILQIVEIDIVAGARYA